MYKNNFTVENVFKNGTINLRDYEGQVTMLISAVLRMTTPLFYN